LVWIIMARSTSSKQSQLDQLLLAARELELARADLCLTPLDVAALLGGDREERHPAAR